MKDAILKWRGASPEIPTLWKKSEECWQTALLNPMKWITYRYVSFFYDSSSDVMYLQLPSGRNLTYHRPGAGPGVDAYGREKIQMWYWGCGTHGKWEKIWTYGGKLTENITQAVGRCIHAAAMLRLEAAGYPIVLHTYDDITSEVPKGHGSVEEFEGIMSLKEPWFHDWPISVSGGWRGARYRKS